MGKYDAVKAVIFDLDNTLYAYDELDKKARGNVEKFTCEKFGISGEQYKEAYQFGRKETKKQLPDVGAGHNRLLYFQKALEYLDIYPMPTAMQMYEQYWGTFLRNMRLFPGVKELFRYLRKEQIPIVICTDLTAHIQHRKIEALGIAEDIKYLVSSEEAGKEKPAKEVFDLCLEKLKLPPEHVWFVGDDLKKDIEGAINAGMYALHFYGAAGEEYKRNAIEHIDENSYMEAKDFKEIENAIKRNITA